MVKALKNAANVAMSFETMKTTVIVLHYSTKTKKYGTQ